MPERKTVSVGLVQMPMSTEPEQNFEKAVSLVRQAAAEGAKIVCLPELFRTQYFCQTEDHANFQWAEPIPGPSTLRLSQSRGGTGNRARRQPV